jgi:hypothetical protein
MVVLLYRLISPHLPYLACLCLLPAEFQLFLQPQQRNSDTHSSTPKPGEPIQVSVGSEDMATAVDQKLLRQTKFPPEFSQKVDMKKVNIEVMKK